MRFDEDGVHINTVLSIDNLPTEILADIFIRSIIRSRFHIKDPSIEEWEKEMKELPPRNLARVCRAWRDIVHSNGALWARWDIGFNWASPELIRMTVHFLRQNILRSGDSPLMFRLTKYGWPTGRGSLDQARQLISSTQHRWAWVEIGEQGDDLIRVDPSQLKLAPLSHLSLSSVFQRLRDVADHGALNNLTQLQLVHCDSTYLYLLSQAIALEELSLRVVGGVRHVTPIHLNRLRKLRVEGDGVGILAERLSCPALEHAVFCDSMTIQDLESFIKRNRTNLFSLRIARLWGLRSDSDFSNLLHLLPSLRSLEVKTLIDEASLLRTLTKQHPAISTTANKTCPVDQQFEVCPSLQYFELYWLGAHKEAMTRFIEARWCTPKRNLMCVRLEGHAPPYYAPGDDLAVLGGTWEPVARCIKGGLQFQCIRTDWCYALSMIENPI